MASSEYGDGWLPTSVFLPGEFFGQRSLTDYSPWGHKDLDTTERLTHNATVNIVLSIYWGEPFPFYLLQVGILIS